jgi:hypothetical protein
MSMNKQLQEVMDGMSPEYLAEAEENEFVYLFTKSFLYLRMGPEAYRRQDFFNRPAEDTDPSDLERIEAGCRQILGGVGFTKDRPLTGLGISGFYSLLNMFHFKLHRQSIAGRLEGRQGMLDRMEMYHVMDGRTCVLFNAVEYEL